LIRILDRKNPDDKNFHCVKNVRKRSRVVACVFVGTNARERMTVSRISGMVVRQVMCDVFGDF